MPKHMLEDLPDGESCVTVRYHDTWNQNPTHAVLQSVHRVGSALVVNPGLRHWTVPTVGFWRDAKEGRPDGD